MDTKVSVELAPHHLRSHVGSTIVCAACKHPKSYQPQTNTPGLNKLLVGFPTTKATALCTFAYCAGPDAEPILFEGRTEGNIVPARGPANFGWDPVFEPVESDGKTYAEMDSASKNQISHRYRALEQLKAYLQKQ